MTLIILKIVIKHKTSVNQTMGLKILPSRLTKLFQQTKQRTRQQLIQPAIRLSLKMRQVIRLFPQIVVRSIIRVKIRVRNRTQLRTRQRMKVHPTIRLKIPHKIMLLKTQQYLRIQQIRHKMSLSLRIKQI